MKNSFIMSVVWMAVIVLVVSFGFTIFFLNGAFANKEDELNDEINVERQSVYVTDESSIRTNNLASLENSDSKNSNLENKVAADKQNFEKEENEKESGEVIESISKINSFVKPIQGDIIKPFAINELLYSRTLNEWITHEGIDYKANLGQEVFSVTNGKIKDIGFNYEHGDYIVIEHENGYESFYSNITVLDALRIGENVEKGQIIGYLAESFGFEAADETHLHFELKKDENYIEIIL